jgi:hypothetical protein
MRQLNTFIFYLLGKFLDSCFLTIRQPIKSNIGAFQAANAGLNLVLDGSQTLWLDVSRDPAIRLRASLARILEVFNTAPESVLPEDVITEFSGAWASFESALGLELGRAPIYYVTPKSVFDTRMLIGKGSIVFTDATVDRLPKEAIDDTDQAGRCLAFSLGTAAGFHIARATEAVILRYMAVFGCAEPKESQRNWGFYLKSLTDAGANPKVVAHLQQIKDLHRNPLIHPEISLGMGEAVSLWSICTSAIQAMVADMETKSATPAADVVSVLPKA